MKLNLTIPCPDCKIKIARTGKSIHYCRPNADYAAHYDTTFVGFYREYRQAEIDLDRLVMTFLNVVATGASDPDTRPAA